MDTDNIIKKKFILILGPQGCGKSTQAKQLGEKLGYQYVSTGDVLRKLKDEKNPVGLKLSEYWITGELVPDELIEEILFPILENTKIKGFIIDGYPRNVNQFRSFISFIEMNSWELDYVLYIDVGEQECIARLKKRVELEKREDETDEAIKRRLEIYNQETSPLLAEYEKLGKLNKVDGEGSIEDIQVNIQKITSEPPTSE